MTDNETIKALEAEIERLHIEGLQINKTFMDFVNKQIAKAIKEFAERLKEKSQRYPYYKYGLIKAVPIDDIDNLVKEMVGDNNG